MSGPMAFLSFKFEIHAPTSCTATGGTLNGSVILIFSSQYFFRSAEISVTSGIIVCRIRYGVWQGQQQKKEKKKELRKQLISAVFALFRNLCVISFTARHSEEVSLLPLICKVSFFFRSSYYSWKFIPSFFFFFIIFFALRFVPIFFFFMWLTGLKAPTN